MAVDAGDVSSVDSCSKRVTCKTASTRVTAISRLPVYPTLRVNLDSRPFALFDYAPHTMDCPHAMPLFVSDYYHGSAFDLEAIEEATAKRRRDVALAAAARPRPARSDKFEMSWESVPGAGADGGTLTREVKYDKNGVTLAGDVATALYSAVSDIAGYDPAEGSTWGRTVLPQSAEESTLGVGPGVASGVASAVNHTAEMMVATEPEAWDAPSAAAMQWPGEVKGVSSKQSSARDAIMAAEAESTIPEDSWTMATLEEDAEAILCARAAAAIEDTSVALLGPSVEVETRVDATLGWPAGSTPVHGFMPARTPGGPLRPEDKHTRKARVMLLKVRAAKVAREKAAEAEARRKSYLSVYDNANFFSRSGATSVAAKGIAAAAALATVAGSEARANSAQAANAVAARSSVDGTATTANAGVALTHGEVLDVGAILARRRKQRMERKLAMSRVSGVTALAGSGANPESNPERTANTAPDVAAGTDTAVTPVENACAEVETGCAPGSMRGAKPTHLPSEASATDKAVTSSPYNTKPLRNMVASALSIVANALSARDAKMSARPTEAASPASKRKLAAKLAAKLLTEEVVGPLASDSDVVWMSDWVGPESAAMTCLGSDTEVSAASDTASDVSSDAEPDASAPADDGATLGCGPRVVGLEKVKVMFAANIVAGSRRKARASAASVAESRVGCAATAAPELDPGMWPNTEFEATDWADPGDIILSAPDRAPNI